MIVAVISLFVLPDNDELAAYKSLVARDDYYRHLDKEIRDVVGTIEYIYKSKKKLNNSVDMRLLLRIQMDKLKNRKK